MDFSNLADPSAPVSASNAIREKLARIGLHSQNDLILHFPLRYDDETHVSAIREAAQGGPVQVEVTVIEAEVKFRPRRQLVVAVEDASGPLTLRFFNFYPNLLKVLEAGARVRCFGEIRPGFFGAEMVHPRCTRINTLPPSAEPALPASTPLPQALTPVYPTTAGVGQPTLRRLIGAALKTADLSDTLPVAWREHHQLPEFSAAVHRLHAPPPDAVAEAFSTHSDPAWRRIKFDELLAQQLSLQRLRQIRREQGAPLIRAQGALAGGLLRQIPFTLTGAQRRVIGEIAADLEEPHPMQRLLQGDVGSGKTIVAAYAACLAMEAGFQVAFMAPTEILAQQHYEKLAAWLLPLGVGIAWLTGSQKARQKKKMQADAAAGAQLVVGTHALIQESVDYAALGLVIIDEQHRFGVAQRLALRKKAANPHQLMMSATPIPRTLAMSYYADLDVSVLDELPPGRSPVRTRLVSEAKRPQIIDFIRSMCNAGSQAYWVCPLIEESEALQLTTALETYARLVAELPELSVGLIHGRLKAEEKTQIMHAFAAGAIQVLVATTVIEVGVDVPNACLMVIEHAERFGLAQLHQLRGRVGRGSEQSHCVLIYAEPLSSMARARLKVIYQQSDGFEIARQDLQLRGPGEFIGARQSGLPMLRYADLEDDVDLLEMARNLAADLLKNDPAVAGKHLARWLGGRMELLKA